MDQSKANTILRPAGAHDAPAIAHAHVASWQATYPGMVSQTYLDSLDAREFTERWRERLTGPSAMQVHVAERQGVVCGFAAAGPSRETVPGFAAELYAIYLLPDAQHQGLGTRLFSGIAQALAAGGHGSMFVAVLEQNPARHFYERMGGVLCGEASMEIGGESLTEVAYGWPDLNAFPIPGISPAAHT